MTGGGSAPNHGGMRRSPQLVKAAQLGAIALLLLGGGAQATPWCQSLQEARAAGPGYPRYRVKQGRRCWYTARAQLARREPQGGPPPEEPQDKRKLPGVPTPTPTPKPYPEPPGKGPAAIEAAVAPPRVTEPFEEIADYLTTPKITTKAGGKSPVENGHQIPLRPLAVTFLACLGAAAALVLGVLRLTAGHVRRL